MPLVEAILHESLDIHRYYLLGCCQFFHRDFVEKLVEIDFFDKFLAATNQFSHGYLPGYNGYDISEHLYPTLARKFGGNIGVFSTYEQPDRWHGSYKVFPMRWQPQLTEEDDYSEASLLHPDQKRQTTPSAVNGERKEMLFVPPKVIGLVLDLSPRQHQGKKLIDLVKKQLD
jgi:hypothetical protein